MQDVSNEETKFNKKIKATLMPLHPKEDQNKIKYVLSSLSDTEKFFVLLL
jgi:hypothetical protein